MQYEPLAGAQVLEEARELPCVWMVSRDDSGIHIDLRSLGDAVRERTHDVQMSTDSGELVGSNHGEYIGDLRLQSPSDPKGKVLLKENVIDLVTVRSGVLVFTGLLHMDADMGSVWLYGKGEGSASSLRKLYDLSGYPKAIGGDQVNTLVVTDKNVSLIDGNLRLKELASLSMGGTFPSSVIADSQGRVYIGTQGFVIRLTPDSKGYAREWFSRPVCSK